MLIDLKFSVVCFLFTLPWILYKEKKGKALLERHKENIQKKLVK